MIRGLVCGGVGGVGGELIELPLLKVCSEDRNGKGSFWGTEVGEVTGVGWYKGLPLLEGCSLGGGLASSLLRGSVFVGKGWSWEKFLWR